VGVVGRHFFGCQSSSRRDKPCGDGDVLGMPLAFNPHLAGASSMGMKRRSSQNPAERDRKVRRYCGRGSARRLPEPRIVDKRIRVLSLKVKSKKLKVQSFDETKKIFCLNAKAVIALDIDKTCAVCLVF